MTTTAAPLADMPTLLKDWQKRGKLQLESFVRFGLTWKDGQRPSDQQLEVIRAIDAGATRLSIRSGHGTGKTTLCAWTLLWFLIAHDTAIIPCTAPTAHQLRDQLWKEVSAAHRRLIVPEWQDSLTILADSVSSKSNPLECRAVARTARRESPEALQGFHGEHLLFIIDEASGIPEETFIVGEGAMSTDGAICMMASNPTRTSGYFYDSHMEQHTDWTRFEFNGEDSPITATGFVERMARKFGPESNVYRVRVLGQFPRAEPDALLTLDEIVTANEREYEPGLAETKASVLGVDVARYGDDDTVLILRRGDKCDPPIVFHDLSTMEVADRVVQAIRAHNPKVINIDVIGIGAGVVDRLLQLGYSVNGVNVAERAGDKVQYDDLRSELWHELARWVREGGSLPDDRELTDELASIKYEISDTTGRTRIESKRRRKDRGLGSPDRGDALMLTFYTPPPEYVTVFG